MGRGVYLLIRYMTWLIELLSWIVLSTGFITTPVTGYQDQIQNYLFTENYIEWADDLQWLRYQLWSDLRYNKTDCSGLFVKYGVDNWLWDFSFGKHNNSYKIRELWERKKDIFNAKRGDFVFFDSSKTYHLAMATTWFDWENLEIIDFIRWDSPEIRKIKLYKCSGWYNQSWCYNIWWWQVFRVYVNTNWFTEEAKRQEMVLDETKKVLEILQIKQDEMIKKAIKDHFVRSITNGLVYNYFDQI